jgi:hypothetical protein
MAYMPLSVSGKPGHIWSGTTCQLGEDKWARRGGDEGSEAYGKSITRRI